MWDRKNLSSPQKRLEYTLERNFKKSMEMLWRGLTHNHFEDLSLLFTLRFWKKVLGFTNCIFLWRGEGEWTGMSFSSPLPQMLLSKLLALFAYQWSLKRDAQHSIPGKVSCTQRCEQQVIGNYGLRLLSLVQTIGQCNGHRQVHPHGQVDQGLSKEKGVGKPVKCSNYQHQTHHFPHCC